MKLNDCRSDMIIMSRIRALYLKGCMAFTKIRPNSFKEKEPLPGGSNLKLQFAQTAEKLGTLPVLIYIFLFRPFCPSRVFAIIQQKSFSKIREVSLYFC